MTDKTTNFQVPAGIPIRAHSEPWPIVEPTMRYLSRLPAWEQPASTELAYVGPPSPAAAGPLVVRASAERDLPDQTLADRALADQPAGAAGRADPGGRAAASPGSASAVEVRRSVEGLLRLALEILDRRRRPEQLKGMATQPVIDALTALSLAAPPGRELGTAVLRKIRIVSAGDRAAEICASYARGPRVFAIAGRVERRRDRWVATTLMLA